MTASGQQSVAPSRIGWFTATCVIISNIIGGGIFTTTGFMARDLGDPWLILVLWIVGALLAIVGALTYAELPAAFPMAGGDYVYLREAYGSLVGFLSGWASFTVGFGAGIAAASVSFAAYVLRLGHSPEQPRTATLVALLLVWAITLAHLQGVKTGGAVQRWLTTMKITAMIVFIVGGVGWGAGQWSHFTETAPGRPSPGPLLVALIFVLYTYLGWNVIGYIAGDVVEPQRTIPRVVIGGTAFVAFLYVLLNIVYLYALPVTVLAEAPLLPVAEKTAAALWGEGAARSVSLLLAVAIAGGVSAMTWAGPRVYWAMAHDGVFSRFFAALTPGTRVPARAMLLQGAWASLLILTGTFEQLVILSGFILAGFTALTLAAVIVLRRRRPGLPRPYRVPLYPIIPVLAITVLVLIVLYSLIERPLESALGVAVVLAGLPIYFLRRTKD